MAEQPNSRCPDLYVPPEQRWGIEEASALTPYYQEVSRSWSNGWERIDNDNTVSQCGVKFPAPNGERKLCICPCGYAPTDADGMGNRTCSIPPNDRDGAFGRQTSCYWSPDTSGTRGANGGERCSPDKSVDRLYWQYNPDCCGPLDDELTTDEPVYFFGECVQNCD